MRFLPLLLIMTLTLDCPFLFASPKSAPIKTPQCAYYTGTQSIEFRSLIVSPKENVNLSFLLANLKDKYRFEFYQKYYIKWLKQGDIGLAPCPAKLSSRKSKKTQPS